MSAGVRKNRGGLVELYQTNLERRIQQGGCNLVCRDEEMFKEVGSLLSKGAAQDTLSPLGLDPLSVMETSLQALSIKPGQTGLEKLAKAFEVLELAALNLYLCPWRKEYRVVKMFSGMFTHYVKPALTSQQAKELFGLLGYQPTGSGEEEELRLGSKPVNADTLLQLACAFFAARVECQLLLSNKIPLGSRGEWELQLVLERKCGHSLHIAREGAKRKLESTLQSSEADMAAELDIYTDDYQVPKDQAKTNHITAPVNSSYTPPKDSLSHSLREGKNDENSGKPQTVCVSKISCQISPKPCSSLTEITELNPTCSGDAKQVAPIADPPINIFMEQVEVEQEMCSCFRSHDLYVYHCVQCGEVHNLNCPWFGRCQKQGHDLRQTERLKTDVPSQPTHGREARKTHNLKNHECMSKPTADIFWVCHNCYNIHDFSCEKVQNCNALGHNVQNTGRLQPPQVPGVNASPQRHTCLRVEDPPYRVCYTCNQSHDCLCEKVQQCEVSAHVVRYLVQTNNEDMNAPSKPMVRHQCCASEQPQIACLTCKVFHTLSCKDEPCHVKHKVQRLNPVCSSCSQQKPSVLCLYCWAQYCRQCWFQDPINCKCGKPFDTFYSSV